MRLDSLQEDQLADLCRVTPGLRDGLEICTAARHYQVSGHSSAYSALVVFFPSLAGAGFESRTPIIVYYQLTHTRPPIPSYLFHIRVPS